MTVYRIFVNANIYQSIYPVSDSREILENLIFDSSPRLSHWKSIDFFVFDARKSNSHFYSLGSDGAFACSEAAAAEFAEFFNFGCEMLPIRLEDGTKLFILNVTDCINMLDERNTIFDRYSDGSLGRVLTYSFHSRFSESSIFKIPQASRTDILTYSGVKSENDEFYSTYMRKGMKGLSFEIVYTD